MGNEKSSGKSLLSHSTLFSGSSLPSGEGEEGEVEEEKGRKGRGGRFECFENLPNPWYFRTGSEIDER